MQDFTEIFVVDLEKAYYWYMLALEISDMDQVDFWGLYTLEDLSGNDPEHRPKVHLHFTGVALD